MYIPVKVKNYYKLILDKKHYCAIRTSAQGVNHEQLLTKKCMHRLYEKAWADLLFWKWWYPSHFPLPPCYSKASKEREVSSDFGMPYSGSSQILTNIALSDEFHANYFSWFYECRGQLWTSLYPKFQQLWMSLDDVFMRQFFKIYFVLVVLLPSRNTQLLKK